MRSQSDPLVDHTCAGFLFHAHEDLGSHGRTKLSNMAEHIIVSALLVGATRAAPVLGAGEVRSLHYTSVSLLFNESAQSHLDSRRAYKGTVHSEEALFVTTSHYPQHVLSSTSSNAVVAAVNATGNSVQ
jgi:hypothetical protein